MPAPDFINLLPADATEYTHQQLQATLDAIAAAGDEKHVGAARIAQRDHLNKIIPKIKALIPTERNRKTRDLLKQAETTLENQVAQMQKPSLGLPVMPHEEAIAWYREALQAMDPNGVIQPPEGGVRVYENLEAQWLGPAVTRLPEVVHGTLLGAAVTEVPPEFWHEFEDDAGAAGANEPDRAKRSRLT